MKMEVVPNEIPCSHTSDNYRQLFQLFNVNIALTLDLRLFNYLLI
jgi:hypothetical protein